MSFDPKRFEDDAWSDLRVGPFIVVLMIAAGIGTLFACFVYGVGPL